MNQNYLKKVYVLNPIQDGGGEPKSLLPPSTSFSFVSPTKENVGFGPKNFWTFSFNIFSTLMQNFKFVPSASPKLLNLNQDHPSNKSDFSGQILINWGYDNFSHRNAAVTKFWSHYQIYNIISIT